MGPAERGGWHWRASAARHKERCRYATCCSCGQHIGVQHLAVNLSTAAGLTTLVQVSVPDWSGGRFARGVTGRGATAASMTPPAARDEDAAAATAGAAVDGAGGSRCRRPRGRSGDAGGDGGRVEEEGKVVRRERNHAAPAPSGHGGDCAANVHANRHLYRKYFSSTLH